MFFPEHDYYCSWNPANQSKQKIKTKSNPSNGSTHQMQIKPITNQNLPQHHRVPISNPLSINPLNPPPINPSTTTEFQNQETKTLDLHKIKLHGRKRKEAPPCAYRKERERERENGLGRETMLPISSFNWCWELLHIGPPRPRWHFTSQCWKS